MALHVGEVVERDRRERQRASRDARAAPRTMPRFLARVEQRLGDASSWPRGRVGARRGARRWRPAASACGRCSSYLSAPVAARERDDARARRRGRRARALGDARPRRRARPRAPLRRGRPTVWATRRRRASPRATGDYLFARAFAALDETGDTRGRRRARRCVARPRAGRGDADAAGAPRPRRPPKQYLERCRSRPAACSRPPARSARASAGSPTPDVDGARALRHAARAGLPDRRRRARLRRRCPSRPASRSAPTCSTAPPRCRCCSPRAPTRPSRPRSPSRPAPGEVLAAARPRRRDAARSPRPARPRSSSSASRRRRARRVRGEIDTGRLRAIVRAVVDRDA